MEKDSADTYNLTIALPYWTLEKQNLNLDTVFRKVIDTFYYTGQIAFFDNAGEIFTLSGREQFSLEFWCENDGGAQYRPTLRATINKSNFKRKLKGINKIQNICCFVLINKNDDRIELPDSKVSDEIKLKGDFNNDKKIDCFIWTFDDQAGNCDGEPKNNLSIMLQVGKENYSLRCCGP